MDTAYIVIFEDKSSKLLLDMDSVKNIEFESVEIAEKTLIYEVEIKKQLKFKPSIKLNFK